MSACVRATENSNKNEKKIIIKGGGGGGKEKTQAKSWRKREQHD